MKRVVRRMGRHSRTRARGLSVDPLLTLQQLAREAHVRIRHSPSRFHELERIVEALTFSPHEISYDERSRARNSMTTVDEHASSLFSDILEIIKNIVQNARDVLGRAVLQPKGLVHKLVFEILGAAEPNAVQHVGYPASLSFLHSNSLSGAGFSRGVDEWGFAPGVRGLGQTPRSSEPALGQSSMVGRIMERGWSGGKQARALLFHCGPELDFRRSDHETDLEYVLQFLPGDDA
ncbi:UBA/THIF-type NAD/FAD binding protein, partial [Striga asiatica]